MAVSLRNVLRRLEASPTSVFWSMPDGALQMEPPQPGPQGLLPGSFDPLHHGHTELRDAAELHVGGAVYYELSVCNVDKPTLNQITIERRSQQFQQYPLALSNAPTFVQKARLFPATTFVVGADTAERIVQANYYAGQAVSVHDALAEIRDHGCDLLVAGRLCGNQFLSLSDIRIPSGFQQLFRELPVDSFRIDISSTHVRRSRN